MGEDIFLERCPRSAPSISSCLTCGPPATMLGTGLPSFSHSSTGAGVPVASHSSATGSFTTTVRGLGPTPIWGGTKGAKKRHWVQKGRVGNAHPRGHSFLGH